VGSAGDAGGLWVGWAPDLKFAFAGGTGHEFKGDKSTGLQAAQSGKCEPVVVVSGELQRVAYFKLAREWTAMQEREDCGLVACEGAQLRWGGSWRWLVELR